MADEKDATPDLRYTEQAERHGVRVERDVSGGGHLARGDRTNMSRLSFSARARPADPGERDPAFTARPAEGSAAETAEPAEPVTPAEAGASRRAAEPVTPAEAGASNDPGLGARIARFFRR
jgi:hypothetical protein